MKKPNPEHIKRLHRLIEVSPYPSLLSMRLVDIGVGFAEIEITIAKKHKQLLGVVHGGVLASLIDTVAFWAVYFGIQKADQWYTSVDLKANYLAPAVSGKLVAKGRQIKVGKKICYASAEILDSKDNILAHGSSTMMILPNKDKLDDFPLPSKFIEEIGDIEENDS
jgi:uncharacterized protein (TIGR00369 family)